MATLVHEKAEQYPGYRNFGVEHYHGGQTMHFRVTGNYVGNFKCQKFAWDLANHNFLGQKLHMGVKILKIRQHLDMPTINQSFTT